MYGSTTKGGGVKKSDCILVCMGALATKGDVVKGSNSILKAIDCTVTIDSSVMEYVIHNFVFEVVLF